MNSKIASLKSARRRNSMLAAVAFGLIVVLAVSSSAQLDTGDHLWNFRENADDRFHSNEAWLRPWRYDTDDGWGRWVGGYSYHLKWGPVSTTGNPDGSLTISRGRDHQFHAWTHVYVEAGKTITLTGSGDCVGRVFLNHAFDSPIHFPATLNLSSGWNRIDITAYNQNSGYTFTCGALAALVDIMNSSQIALNNPPAAEAGGPYAADEGSPVTFDGSGSSDPDADPLEYRWDFDDDGTWDTGWSSSPTSPHTWVDDWSGVARLEVRDGEFTDDDTAAVTISNVAPVPDAGPDQTVNEGDTVSFTGNPGDPGIADVHVIDWDFGDGDTAAGTWTPTHEYGDNDVYAVTLTVTDDDAGVGADTLVVTVNNLPPTAAIDSLVQPNPDFILPGHMLMFTGNFSDPGWLDTHVCMWDFGDGTVALGGVVEEHDPPDAAGVADAAHAYATPGVYAVMLIVIDDDEGDGLSPAFIVTVDSVGNVVQILDDYIQALADDAFNKHADKRREILGNWLDDIADLIADGLYDEAEDRLVHNIRAKADGSVDGNPHNDWIVDPDAQQVICDMVDEIVDYLNSL